MDLKALFDTVKAALPPETTADALKLLDDTLEGAQKLADAEVETALHTLPPAWAPVAPQLQAFAENAIAAAEAEAAKWAALKATVAQ